MWYNLRHNLWRTSCKEATAEGLPSFNTFNNDDDYGNDDDDEDDDGDDNYDYDYDNYDYDYDDYDDYGYYNDDGGDDDGRWW